MERTPAEAFRRACDIVGGPVQMSRHLDVTYQSVWNWLKSGRVPAQHIPAITERTGVPDYWLRPDLFEAPKAIEAD